MYVSSQGMVQKFLNMKKKLHFWPERGKVSEIILQKFTEGTGYQIKIRTHTSQSVEKDVIENKIRHTYNINYTSRIDRVYYQILFVLIRRNFYFH